MLKRVKRVKKSDDAWLKCCRWCKEFDKGVCLIQGVEANQNICEIYDNGKLKDLIVESTKNIGTDIFVDILDMLEDFKISKKRQEQLREKLVEGVEEYNQLLTESLEDDISSMYEEFVDYGTYSLLIGDPEEYVCQYWR